MSIDSQEQMHPKKPWYADYRVKAICSILGVGVSLAGLLIAVGLWVQSGQQSSSDEIPPVGNDNAADAETLESIGHRGRPLDASDRGGESYREPEAEGESDEGVEAVDPADLSNVAEEDEPRSVYDGSAADKVTLSSKTDFTAIIQGTEVSLPESIDTRDPVFVVAETVSLASDAVLRSPEIWILADEITGGSLDVSGFDGTTDTRDGADAGSIYILAERVSNVATVAMGGKGLPGRQGARGPRGRNGRCDGFGRWRPAQRGGDGGPGEAGVTGGDGGDIRVVFGVSYKPQEVNRDGGLGGDGGAGGVGGGGGDGCVGLGGAQSSAASGSPGPSGVPGRNGDEGELFVQQKPRRVTESLDWLRQRTVSVEALRYVRKADQDDSVL